MHFSIFFIATFITLALSVKGKYIQSSSNQSSINNLKNPRDKVNELSYIQKNIKTTTETIRLYKKKSLLRPTTVLPY